MSLSIKDEIQCKQNIHLEKEKENENKQLDKDINGPQINSISSQKFDDLDKEIQDKQLNGKNQASITIEQLIGINSALLDTSKKDDSEEKLKNYLKLKEQNIEKGKNLI